METDTIVRRGFPDVIDGFYYPSGDGKPMAETAIHVKAIHLLLDALDDYFEDRPEVCVFGDNFWYWERGNPEACVAPDVGVFLTIGRRDRRSFKSWEEGGAVPAAIFEMASENTWRENLEEKRLLYQRQRVPEYFIFDPTVEYIGRALMGYRLHTTRYRRIKADKDGGLLSEALGLRLVPEGRMLRLSDARTGVPILTRRERTEQEHQLGEQARQEAELEHQRAEQEKQRADEEKKRADEEKLRAQQQQERAEQEKARADGLAAQLARMQARLKAAGLNGSSPTT